LRAIASSLLAGEDWTGHLAGLPFVEEIPAAAGETCGRDLRGADLRRYLVPEVRVDVADEGDAGVVAALALEGQRTTVALPDASPFPVEGESAEDVAVAMRKGDVFLLALCGSQPAGVARLTRRTELEALVGQAPYAEISGLSVTPALRRLGMGTRLVREAEARACQLGLGHALLRTLLELGLVDWYERLGYARRLVRPWRCRGGVVLTDVVLTRALPAPEAPSVAGASEREEAHALGPLHPRDAVNGSGSSPLLGAEPRLLRVPPPVRARAR
jgi:GNAT superfamily N-acetyltransferase